jgi:hypothetical protein
MAVWDTIAEGFIKAGVRFYNNTRHKHLMMTESFYDWVVYCITGVIMASALLEGKRTRFPAAFFYGSIVLLVVLIVAGGLNWWFYRSKFGSVVVIFAATTLLMTRFRMVIYALRFRSLVAGLQSHVNKGFRIILVLPENEDEKIVLMSMLSKKIPAGALFYTQTALGPYSGIYCMHWDKSILWAKVTCFSVSNNFLPEPG